MLAQRSSLACALAAYWLFTRAWAPQTWFALTTFFGPEGIVHEVGEAAKIKGVLPDSFMPYLSERGGRGGRCSNAFAALAPWEEIDLRPMRGWFCRAEKVLIMQMIVEVIQCRWLASAFQIDILSAKIARSQQQNAANSQAFGSATVKSPRNRHVLSFLIQRSSKKLHIRQLLAWARLLLGADMLLVSTLYDQLPIAGCTLLLDEALSMISSWSSVWVFGGVRGQQ